MQLARGWRSLAVHRAHMGVLSNVLSDFNLTPGAEDKPSSNKSDDLFVLV